MPLNLSIGPSLRKRRGSDRRNEVLNFRISSALALLLCMALVFPVAASADETEFFRLWTRISPEKPQDLESGMCKLEIAPYFQTGRGGSSDSAAIGLLFKADIGRNWEFRASSDGLSYDDRQWGISDLSLGVKWKALDGDFPLALALALDVEFPIGTRDFRESGVEPTLSLLMSRKFGQFEPSCSLSLTYVSAETGEQYYLSPQVSLGIDYTADDKNSFGVFATAYAPASNTDHSPRAWIGGSYTRTLTDRHSVSATLMRGISCKGMDWSFGVTYDYTV
jgi:hypothetical protein